MSENFPQRETDHSCSHHQCQSSCRMMFNVCQEAEILLPFTPEQHLNPVMNLTREFGNLSTLAGDTPRRCLDLSNLSNEEEEMAFSFSHSPGTLETGQKSSTGPEDPQGSRRQCVQQLQPQVLCSTPSGIRRGSREISSPSLNKENEGRPFKHPGWHMAKSLLFQKRLPISQQACYDAVEGAGRLEMKDLGSPIATVAPPRIPGAFSELCPDEQEEAEKPLADHLSSMAILLSGPLLTQDINVSEVSMNKSRLFRSPSLPEKLNKPLQKRPVKVHSDETVLKVKQNNNLVQEEPDGMMLLKKTVSLSDMEIIRALDQDYGIRQLIGDFSSVYALPTVTGRHQDLKYISAETVSHEYYYSLPPSLSPMAALLQDQFQSLIEKFFTIDCRYPYEYHVGHIKGALNIHRQEDLFDFFLRKPLFPSAPQKRLILVFHCEYSSERGPKMCHYLREEDRAMNEYPALHYPELYVLQGGYKDFFSTYKELCEPQGYCPMHHQDFKAELLKCRVKSKVWAGERKRRDQVARLMKL
ncbi:M-phase inducer phosphatase 3 isoform X1 [Pogona vitticeps]